MRYFLQVNAGNSQQPSFRASGHIPGSSYAKSYEQDSDIAAPLFSGQLLAILTKLQQHLVQPFATSGAVSPKDSLEIFKSHPSNSVSY